MMFITDRTFSTFSMFPSCHSRLRLARNSCIKGLISCMRSNAHTRMLLSRDLSASLRTRAESTSEKAITKLTQTPAIEQMAETAVQLTAAAIMDTPTSTVETVHISVHSIDDKVSGARDHRHMQ